MRTLVIRVAVFDAAASLICVLVVDAGLLMQYNKYHMVSDNCLCQ